MFERCVFTKVLRDSEDSDRQSTAERELGRSLHQTMKPLSPDTSPEAQRKQYELMSRLSPTERLKLADLTEAMRKLVMLISSTDIRWRTKRRYEESLLHACYREKMSLCYGLSDFED